MTASATLLPLDLEKPGLSISAKDDDFVDIDQHFLRSTERTPPPEKPTRTIRAVDLFCGCGGLSLGLRQACDDLDFGFEAAWAVDSDKRALEVYRDNFAPAEHSNEPIEEILTEKMGTRDRSAAEEKRAEAIGRPIDFLLAGPPCQGHSGLNNKTRHEDERNSLYDRVGRFVDLFEPEHVLIENVPTVVVDRNRTIHQTVNHLEDLGYHVSPHVFDFSKIGVPQRRKRHIVLASRSWKGHGKSIELEHKVAEPRTVRWAIGDLEDAAPSEPSLFDRPSVLSEENRKRVQYLIDHGLVDLPNPERPICHQNDEHSYKSMYGRLSWGEPAQTITTGYGSPGQGRFIHPSKPRTLTPHEAARLQFFPDFFDFSSVEYRSALAKMIGNAVPCKLAWIVGLELLR